MASLRASLELLFSSIKKNLIGLQCPPGCWHKTAILPGLSARIILPGKQKGTQKWAVPGLAMPSSQQDPLVFGSNEHNSQGKKKQRGGVWEGHSSSQTKTGRKDIKKDIKTTQIILLC